MQSMPIVRLLTFIVCVIVYYPIAAQLGVEAQRGIFDKRKDAGIFSGYVKFDSYFDTRQVVGFRDDHYLVSPEKPIFDANGKDINARPQFIMTAIESRLRYTLTTEKIREMELCNGTGVIEADFFGFAARNVEVGGTFRMRHAYIEIKSKSTILVFGHTWHPIAQVDCFPDTISFNGGSPFDPYSRNPIILLTLLHPTGTQVLFGVASQFRFTNDGPDGFTNTYIKNALMPNLHFQVKKKLEKHTWGAGYDVKRLAPRIRTNRNFITHESIMSNAFFVYYSFFDEYFSFCIKYSLCQNGTDFGTLGGYGVHSIDQLTDKRTYANTASSHIWFDIAMHTTEHITPGLFFGYASNHGAMETIIPDLVEDGIVIEKRIFGEDPTIGALVRVQPRVRIKYDPIVIGLEGEMTAAAFGSLDEFARVKNQKWTTNIRLLFAVWYMF